MFDIKTLFVVKTFDKKSAEEKEQHAKLLVANTKRLASLKETLVNYSVGLVNRNGLLLESIRDQNLVLMQQAGCDEERHRLVARNAEMQGALAHQVKIILSNAEVIDEMIVEFVITGNIEVLEQAERDLVELLHSAA